MSKLKLGRGIETIRDVRASKQCNQPPQHTCPRETASSEALTTVALEARGCHLSAGVRGVGSPDSVGFLLMVMSSGLVSYLACWRCLATPVKCSEKSMLSLLYVCAVPVITFHYKFCSSAASRAKHLLDLVGAGWSVRQENGGPSTQGLTTRAQRMGDNV